MLEATVPPRVVATSNPNPRLLRLGLPRRRRALATLVVVVLVASLAALDGPVSAAPAGTLSTFAGGLGEGPATEVFMNPYGLAARDGRLVSVENGFYVPYSGPWPGLVRAVDLTAGTTSVLAGIQLGGYGGDGGPATSAQLARPMDAAIDAAGNVYITDTDNARVRKVTPAGIITTVAGNGVVGFTGDGAAATSASLNRPTGIAVSPAGDLVFADRSNLRVRKVSPSGTITTIAGTGQGYGPTGDGGPATAAVIVPWAVAFDPAGNLYVTDTPNGSSYAQLRRIAPNGSISTISTHEIFGGALAVDASGVYLSASPGIVRLDPSSGTVTTVAGTTDSIPPGAGNGDGGLATATEVGGHDFAVDGGNLYLSDANTTTIRRIDPSGIITTIAGKTRTETSDGSSGDGGTARGAQFSDVAIVRSGPTGTYVASTYYGTVRRIDPSGLMSTLYNGGLTQMAVDDAGNVFLSRGHQVLRLSASGSLATVAGTGEAGFSGDGGPAVLARLSRPKALAVDSGGSVYVADSENLRIRRIDALGIITTLVGGSPGPSQINANLAAEANLGFVDDLALDGRGNLYWTETGDSVFRIRKLTCGIVGLVAVVRSPRGGSLVADSAGSLYFTADTEVRRLAVDGTLSTVAGSGGAVSHEGIAARSAALFETSGIAIHPSGRLLFGHDRRVLQVEGVTTGRATAGPPCSSLPDRPVWGTGYNALGQLGDGTTTDRDHTAADNPPLTGVASVSGGVGHTLARRADGTVWAWGSNDDGQLGDGTTTQRLRPVPVSGLTGVVAVASGAFHSLALKADGTVWAWGWNPFGQLGDGTTATRLRPVRVAGLTGVVAIAGGTLHSLAVTSDGSVWAWGWNGVGQLGDGTGVDRGVPFRVPGIGGATGVAAGGLHSLAVKADGTVWAWGWNLFGQLGDGSTVDHRVPAPVQGLTGAKAVAAGSYHSLALKGDGSVVGWGFGNVGQVGNSTLDSSLTPVTAAGVTGVVAIAAGAFHSLALTSDGRVMGWGWNYFGQLAAGPADIVRYPAELMVLNHATAIGGGAFDSLFAHRFGP